MVIVLFGCILRILAANNAHLNPDELAYALTPVNFISTGKISTFHQSPAYFYLTDIGYQLFGVSALTSRLTAIIFGSLTIIIVYFLAHEFFNNKKKSLIAAFLFAISGYSIRFNTEMDGIAIFFVMLSLLYYIKGLKYKETYFLYSAVFLALAFLNKPLAAVLAPLFILYISSSVKN
jgi:4-amino-4-deoxy-L-arabinose transferase-like glycosyltransferase